MVFVGAENGVYFIDKSTGDFGYDYEISSKIESQNVKFIQYHSFSDHIWIVTKTDVYYKSMNSSIWRELSLFDVGLNSIYGIDDVGITPDYIWFKSGQNNIPINPFNGKLDTLDTDNTESDFIEWGYSRFGQEHNSTDLSYYRAQNGWNIHLNSISSLEGARYMASIVYVDKDGFTWVGTEEGHLFKATPYSRKLKLMKNSPHTNILSTSFLDDRGIWWFADSEFLRTGNMQNVISYYNNSDYFLSYWDEVKNIWKYYSLNTSTHIKNSDVLSIDRSGNNVYLATIFGILVLDLIDNDWSIIEQNDGLHDQAVWDLVVDGKSLWCATSRGINEVSTINNVVIPHNDDIIFQFDNIEIYDIEKANKNLLIASANGLYLVNNIENTLTKLSDKIFRSIQIEGELIYGISSNNLYVVSTEKDELVHYNVYNFSVNDNFIWLSEKSGVILFNLETGDRFYYDQDDGIPGNIIYKVDCDNEWVWFMTNNGFAIYNWGKYHVQ